MSRYDAFDLAVTSAVILSIIVMLVSILVGIWALTVLPFQILFTAFVVLCVVLGVGNAFLR